MKNKHFISLIIMIISIILMVIMKFILIKECGFLELFLMILCFLLLVVNMSKVVKNTLLKVVLVLVIIWFSMLSIDYKRHRNMYQPLFVMKNQNSELDGLGYKIIQEYNQEGDYVYQSGDKFYLFGILIDEVEKIDGVDIVENKQVDKMSLEVDKNEVMLLRAGGGSSGGSGGSGGGSSGSHTTSGTRNSSSTSLLERVLSNIIFFILFFFTAIVFYLKVIRASINSKRLLRLLDDKDKSWNYKSIEKQVINTFYSVQHSWSDMDMTASKEYMAEDLYENFNVKLEWMQMVSKRNVLKKIRLIDLRPISVYDDENDCKDLIWFYIKGKMIDYVINTETNEKIEGNDYSKSFIEFWKFVRKGDKWVLAKILQKEESDLIKFQD